jgi:hypothetical protein
MNNFDRLVHQLTTNKQNKTKQNKTKADYWHRAWSRCQQPRGKGVNQ